MWKKREWYLLPPEERMRVMRGHIETGKRYTGIEINTAYSYGLDDQEFVVSFNADEPGEFLDLVQELRSTESSAYTESETPIFTCISAVAERALDALDGESLSLGERSRNCPASTDRLSRLARGALAGRVQHFLDAGELHPRAALRLAGGLLGGVDQLPARDRSRGRACAR